MDIAEWFEELCRSWTQNDCLPPMVRLIVWGKDFEHALQAAHEAGQNTSKPQDFEL